MRSSKGSHRIVIQGVEYRWVAQGNDDTISIGIWPANNIGPAIRGRLRYHETDVGKGKAPTLPQQLGQIVVTNRIIRRIIEHAISEHQYDPSVKGEELYLGLLDDLIHWDDAVRPER